MLINKRESTSFKHLNDSKGFIEYQNYVDDIYKDIEEYNGDKRQKTVIIFDNVIADNIEI